MKKFKFTKLNIIILSIIAAIFATIYWAYFLAPKTSDTDKVKLVVYENNVLKEEENGKLIWQLSIGKMSINPLTQKAIIENVEGTFYNEDNTELHVKAEYGEYDEKTRNVVFNKGFNVTSNTNVKFTSENLLWNNDEKVLIADGNVIITKDDLKATANKAISKDNFKNFKLMGNAKIIKGGN